MSNLNEKDPLVSVIMSVYNTNEIYLRSAINSLINQTYKNLEIIIVDDASKGEIINKVKSDFKDKRIKFYSNNINMGLTFSLNFALSKTKGKYIARMDSDDIAVKTRIEKQVNFMENNAHIKVLGSRAKNFGDSHNYRLALSNNKKYFKAFSLFNSSLTHPSVMMQKEFLLENKLKYDEKYLNSQDYDLWNRFLDYGDIIWELPEVLLFYRISDKQISNNSNNSTQLINSRIIRADQIKKLSILPSKREFDIHNFLCEGITVKKIQSTEIIEWIKVLLKYNKLTKFCSNNFLKIIISNQILSILVKRKETSLNWGISRYISLLIILNYSLIFYFYYKFRKKIITIIYNIRGVSYEEDNISSCK